MLIKLENVTPIIYLKTHEPIGDKEYYYSPEGDMEK